MQGPLRPPGGRRRPRRAACSEMTRPSELSSVALAQQKPARDTDLGSIAMHTHAHKVRMRTTYGLQQTGAQDAVVVRVVTGRHHVVRIVLPTFNTRLPKKYKSLLALNSSNTESDHSFGTSLSSPVTFDAVFCFPFPFARLQVCPFALWVILWATLSESLSTLRVNLQPSLNSLATLRDMESCQTPHREGECGRTNPRDNSRSTFARSHTCCWHRSP